MLKEVAVAFLSYYPIISMKNLRKTTKILGSQDGWPLGLE
jgi:hypothetical protein